MKAYQRIYFESCRNPSHFCSTTQQIPKNLSQFVPGAHFMHLKARIEKGAIFKYSIGVQEKSKRKTSMEKARKRDKCFFGQVANRGYTTCIFFLNINDPMKIRCFVLLNHSNLENKIPFTNQVLDNRL